MASDSTFTSASASSMDITETVGVKEYESFDDMAIPTNILRGIYAFGFEKPSQIQKKAIMPIVEGHDVLAQAQSGTGKTGTFVIGSLSRIDPEITKPQILVMVPTRELAQQIPAVATGIGSYLCKGGLRVHAATGGPPVHDDIRAIDRGVHMLVVTPGRIYDLLNRKAFEEPTPNSNRYVKLTVIIPLACASWQAWS
jgi:translation initiation factor 4A